VVWRRVARIKLNRRGFGAGPPGKGCALFRIRYSIEQSERPTQMVLIVGMDTRRSGPPHGDQGSWCATNVERGQSETLRKRGLRHKSTRAQRSGARSEELAEIKRLGLRITRLETTVSLARVALSSAYARKHRCYSQSDGAGLIAPVTHQRAIGAAMKYRNTTTGWTSVPQDAPHE
jgi:hypothetical protein